MLTGDLNLSTLYNVKVAADEENLPDPSCLIYFGVFCFLTKVCLVVC